MPYGIKIALPGFNVNTATIEQLAITSERSMHKQERAGSIAYTFSGSPATVTILTVTHSLGYVPSFRASWIYSGRGGMLAYNDINYGGFDEQIEAEATTTQFFIKYISNEMTPSTRTGQNWTFKYSIDYDRGA